MSDATYKKIKKQNGERFAQTLRNFHSGLLELPDIDSVVRYAGREAKDLLPYLMSLMAANDDKPQATLEPRDPYVLLDEAGYDAFHADTLKKQNSIKRYFKKGELLCTFNDNSRFEDYHMVHAVKKNVDEIKRAKKGETKRQDEYGTSVISIQMLKSGGFISIKNRYNHTVVGCDNTFDSNPDNIIDGLSDALRNHFNVEFTATESPIPDGYTLIADHIFRYSLERNNIYYGDQSWAQNGKVYEVDRSAGDALFDGFLFDNKTKTLRNIDPKSNDSFPDYFNAQYGGDRGLSVQKGNLVLGEQIIIGAENSAIVSLDLPELIEMKDNFLQFAHNLKTFNAPNLESMGNHCLHSVRSLIKFNAPNLNKMGDQSLYSASALPKFDQPKLQKMGESCFSYVGSIKNVHVPLLSELEDRCFNLTRSLEHFHGPALTKMGDSCLGHVTQLERFNAPVLETMGGACFNYASQLKEFDAPVLKTIGNHCFGFCSALEKINTPKLTTIGISSLYGARRLKEFNAPDLKDIGRYSLSNLPSRLSLKVSVRSTLNRLRASRLYTATFGSRPEPVELEPLEMD